MRILIVEDKRAFASHIGRALEGEGHSVDLAFDGDEALRLGRTANFDLMLLDIMLPRHDGFSIIRKLREDRLQTQTILVSARDSMEDIIRGLDAGADDYLTKPFALDVLLAKVRATERRIPLVPPQSVQFEDVVLRPHLCELQRGTRIEPLTRTETALLETLMRRARTVVPHRVLLEEGWGLDTDVSFDSLYVFMRALRGKLTRPGSVSGCTPSVALGTACAETHVEAEHLHLASPDDLVCGPVLCRMGAVWRQHVGEPAPHPHQRASSNAGPPY